MAYDPVLERDMFRPKSRGVVSLDDTKEEEISDDLKARRERAQALIDAAKEKFDPKNFQTLTDQDRPGVFRPVAVNMPAPQQTINTAQRMQQMAAQGVRPVGMARGGHVYHFADGGMRPTINSSGYTENLTSGEQDILAKEKASEATMGLRTLGAGVEPTDLLTDEERDAVRIARKEKAPYDPYQLEGGSPAGMTYNLADDPTTWTPDFRAAMTNKIYKERVAEWDKLSKSGKQPYFERPTLSDISDEIDRKATDIYASRRKSWPENLADPRDYAAEDAARRAEAAPDKRDFGQEREYASNLRAIEDAARRAEAAPDKRDFAQERAYNTEQQKGITALGDMEKGVATGRDAYGAEAPLAVDQEAKGLAALRDSVRMGDQPGAVADASRAASGIRSGEDKAASPVTDETPATGGIPPAGGKPATGGAQPSQGGLGSFKQQGEAIDTGPMSIEGIRAERAREREENINLALIQAGLSMMAGTSSNAFTNIGEGALAGVRQFATGESESKKLMRESTRDLLEQQRVAQQEKLTREEMALRERLSAAQIKATSDLAAAQRASTEGMFKTTEDRLNTAMLMDWNKTQAAQDIAREELKIKQDLANNTISSAEADRKLKDAHFKRQIEFDEWKVTQGLAAPSDTMKLYEAIGGGDLNKGLKIVQDASTMDSKVRAAQDVLNPMSGASEDEKAAALAYLRSVIKVPGATGAVDLNNPLLKKP